MSFNPKSVKFDGVNDYYLRGGGLTGATDSKTGSCYFWLYTPDATQRTKIFVSANGYVRITYYDGYIQIHARNIGGIIQIFNSSVLATDTWHCILASWDVAVPNQHLYVNDANDFNDVSAAVDSALDNTEAEWWINKDGVGPTHTECKLSEFYYNTTEYIDFSIEANRRKFISASGKPVPLGTRGATPTGTKPIIYMSNDYPGLNLGTGGHFDVIGSPQVVEGPNPVTAVASGFDPALLEFFPDTIGIEPFDTMTAQQVFSYGASVSYQSQITSMSARVIDAKGREVTSTARVTIPQRVFIDTRSRITLPEGFVPRTPPILGVRPVGGALGLDHTEILL